MIHNRQMADFLKMNFNFVHWGNDILNYEISNEWPTEPFTQLFYP